MALIVTIIVLPAFAAPTKLPRYFVTLHSVDPTIEQEIRYAGDHNLLGRPVDGYLSSECILTKQAAKALRKVQQELRPLNYSLKVYDCYRPQRASKDFYKWSVNPHLQDMKQEFFPRVDKQDFFDLGYVALYSGHSRGSTVDLTIIPIDAEKQPEFKKGQKLQPCYAPRAQRFPDNSIDMGSGYDCLDKQAHYDADNLSEEVKLNRKLLRVLMERHGFVPYEKEWWHFTLKKEPYKRRFYDFVVQ